MNSFVEHFKESYNELVNKVTWPTWPNLISSTRVVIVASILITLVIFIMDTISLQITGFIYDL
ncbi:MAG: preprotein translocase subunit SecE [Saprospirales bacterium]|nr:MAG: preprotein translocase subunit SecE [Saprospirales bacterium]